jgi:UDP-glucose 4-epimerase
VYGPRERNNPYSSVTTIFISRILKNQPPIIYGDGKQTRDFINVHDVVDANLLALQSKNAVGETFNIGTGTRISVKELAGMLLKITNKKDLKPIYGDPKSGDIRLIYADISKAKKTLGFHPKVSLKEGLGKLVDWYTVRTQQNTEWQ